MTTIITGALSRSRHRGQFWNGDEAAVEDTVNRQEGQVRYDTGDSFNDFHVRSSRRDSTGSSGCAALLAVYLLTDLETSPPVPQLSGF
jgi:hypothetical protein